jgi:hypothetical protein
MIYAGIENGAEGALVVLSELPGLRPVEALKLPQTVLTGRNAPDVSAILAALAIYPKDNLTVILERCPDHSQNKAAMRSMAMGCGLIEGALIARRFRYHVVPAQTWQKKMLGKVPAGQTKAAAEAVAIKTWPDLHQWARRPRGGLHDGKIDAALIAEFARREKL